MLTRQHCNNRTYPKLFTARAAGAQARRAVLTALAALWALPADRAEWLTQLHKPELRAGPSEVGIGRAVLPVVADERAQREGASSAVCSRAIACGAVQRPWYGMSSSFGLSEGSRKHTVKGVYFQINL